MFGRLIKIIKLCLQLRYEFDILVADIFGRERSCNLPLIIWRWKGERLDDDNCYSGAISPQVNNRPPEKATLTNRD